MLFLILAVKPYQGILEPDYSLVNSLEIFFAIFAVLLLVLSLVVRVYKKVRENKTRWTIFRQMARARGLSKEQIAVLALIARQAQVKRPTRLLGSLQFLDRALENVLEKEQLDAQQIIIADSIRTKLSTAKEVWSKSDGDRRQVARVRCSWNARLELVSEEAMGKEVQRLSDVNDSQLMQIADGLIEAGNFFRHRVQIGDISSGGVSLLASPNFKGSDGDIARLAGDSDRIPFSINGIFAQLVSIEKDDKRGLNILHMKFLPMDAGIRKLIIQFVYEKVESAESTGKNKKLGSRPRLERKLST